MLCLSFAVGIDTVRRVAADVASGRADRAVSVALVLLLVPPVVNAVRLDLERRKMMTEEVAARWIEAHVSKDDLVLMETGVIKLRPGYHYDYTHQLSLATADTYRSQGVKYLVTSSEKFNETTSPPQAAAYRRLLESSDVLTQIKPTETTRGPTLTVLRLHER
jgi:hypothetical protein